MSTPKLLEAEANLILVRDFLIGLNKEQRPFGLNTVSGAIEMLTGDEDFAHVDLPKIVHIERHLNRIAEVTRSRNQ